MDNFSVRTENLTRRFGKFTAVNRVSLQVEKGEIFGFLGANGAGKTTLIRMLCGLLKPSGGTAQVAGFDIYREPEKIKQCIGYMSQKFSLYEDLTPGENLEFYGGIYGLNRRVLKEKKRKIFQQVGLLGFGNKLTRELPLGFKQRLALASALLHNPAILFLDEPTSGVDPEARHAFWDIIYLTAAEGKTIFVTTHFMDEAEYCNRVAIMHLGNVIALDRPRQLKLLFQKETMQEVFISLLKEKMQNNPGNIAE